MEKAIKLIWDFRGPDAAQTARHHQTHLKEYVKAEALNPGDTGFKDLSDNHSMAFLVVSEHQMPQVRDALRPHRGELHDYNP